MIAEDIINFNLVDLVSRMSQGMIDFLNRYESLGFWIAAIAVVASIICLVMSIYGKVRKRLEDSIFIVFSSFVLLITVAAFLETLYLRGEVYDKALPWIGLAAYAAYVSLPAVYYLHVWSQVNYRRIGVGRVIGCFIVPGLLTASSVIHYITNELDIIVGDFVPNVWTYQSILPLQYSGIVFIIFFIVMTIKSLLLCFNVFYQMPKHMRASTRLLISAIAVACVVYTFAFFANNHATFMIFLLALIFVLERTYSGFFRASASNVIATSREFVFSNLSTMVLVLSRKGRILEWNRSRANFIYKLLVPRYRQPFNNYRTKLIEAGDGVVSKHDENIITLTEGGAEHHLMITRTPIREGEREFGQLIEIVDITNIYSVLSYLESIASYDHLTKLYNRNAYLGVAKNAIREGNLPLLVIVGDVNNLKLVNDSVGHIEGDKLLMTLAETIREFVPPESFVARIGGDEFVIIVPNAGENVAEKFAENVRTKTQRLYSDEFGKPDISLGWAVARTVGEDYNEVFKKADQMMYREKKIYKAMVGISLSGIVPSERDGATSSFNDEQTRLSVAGANAPGTDAADGVAEISVADASAVVDGATDASAAIDDVTGNGVAGTPAYAAPQGMSQGSYDLTQYVNDSDSPVSPIAGVQTTTPSPEPGAQYAWPPMEILTPEPSLYDKPPTLTPVKEFADLLDSEPIADTILPEPSLYAKPPMLPEQKPAVPEVPPAPVAPEMIAPEQDVMFTSPISQISDLPAPAPTMPVAPETDALFASPILQASDSQAPAPTMPEPDKSFRFTFVPRLSPEPLEAITTEDEKEQSVVGPELTDPTLYN